MARRLRHGRDLGEPFDFLTWFEFDPEHAKAFDDEAGAGAQIEFTQARRSSAASFS